MRNDPLADTMNNMLNAERIGRRAVEVKPYSKIIGKVLDLLKTHGYITGYEVKDDRKGGIITITLAGQINNCGVIKPRFSITKNEYEKFENRYLPAKDFGILIVSTSQGIMTHTEAKEKNIGGRLISYCY